MPPAIEAQPAAESANRPDADKEQPSVPHQMQLQPYTPLELAVGDGAEHEQESNAGLTRTSFADGARFLPAPTDFLSWASFGEVTLRPRKNARRSRLDRIISPLKSVGAGLPGNVSVEGLGGLIESAHGIFHSVRRLDFMESERTMYMYSPPTPGGPRVPAPDKLPRRELERYEDELFDLSKYNGASDYLTAMAWTEEAMSGSLTLYRVLSGIAGEATGVRPVAAMRDVPSQVLARMRTDGRVRRKAVVTLIEDDDRTFDWKANPGRGPRYVRLASSGVRSPGRSSSNSSRYRGPGMADADGVCATLPQFFALLHSRRSLLENVGSSWVTQTRTDDGEAHPMVFLTKSPQSSPHEGNRVHVAVLVPNDALWAEDEFIWTDQTGLAEFRQRQYWDLIEPPSRRARGRSRSRRRERDDAGPTRSPIRGRS